MGEKKNMISQECLKIKKLLGVYPIIDSSLTNITVIEYVFFLLFPSCICTIVEFS